MDLVGWRKKLRGRPGDSEGSVALAAAVDDDDPDAVPPLTEETLALCLGLYVDCLLIVQSVHQAHVLHFDLKCNNFILRVPAGQAVDHAAIRRAHLQGKPSGILFLADFGEAVPLPAPVRRGGSAEAIELARLDAAGGPSTRSRSRGTLPIQSPEMICLNFGSEGGGGGGGSEAVTPAKAGGGGGGTQRKVFPAPGCPSDVWSLGCMLGELVTGRFLLADRPWTDLYVSLCMHKYVAPPLETLRAAVRQAHPQVADRVCAMVARALHQEPSSRARLVELYEEAMRILLDYHLLEASGTPVAQSRHSFLTHPGGAAVAGAGAGGLAAVATSASMKKGATLQSLGTKLLERSWKVRQAESSLAPIDAAPILPSTIAHFAAHPHPRPLTASFS